MAEPPKRNQHRLIGIDEGSVKRGLDWFVPAIADTMATDSNGPRLILVMLDPGVYGRHWRCLGTHCRGTTS